MKPINRALAGLAAIGLALSQPAAAATAARSGSPANDSEHLAGTPGAAIPALVAILAVAIISIISASNHDHHPASP